jgi:hypothetical protein
MQTRIVTVEHESFAYTLPNDWALTDPAGEISFILTQQGVGGCDFPGTASDPVTVVATPLKPGTSAPPIKLTPDTAYVCSRTLVVTGLVVGADVSIVRADGQTLFDWTKVRASTIAITLPLKLGLLPNTAETIVAQERGCKTDLTSNPIRVVQYPADRLPAPGFTTSAHPYVLSVTLKGLVPGARVYIMVNGNRFMPSGDQWSGDVDVTAETQTIALLDGPPLGSMVSAAQSLCGPKDSSPADAPGVVSEKAHIILTRDPSGPITRGKTTAFTFHCQDQDTPDKDLVRWGFVILNGAPAPCGGVISVTILSGDLKTSLDARLADTPFNHATHLTIPIVNPVPPPPPPPAPRSMRLLLSAAPSSFIPANSVSAVTVSAVQWNVTPNWAGGVMQPLTGAINGSRFRASAIFTVPSSVTVPIVQVTGTVTFTDDRGSQVFSMVGQMTLSATGPMCIPWSLAFNYVDGVRHWANGQIGDVVLNQGVGPC